MLIDVLLSVIFSRYKMNTMRVIDHWLFFYLFGLLPYQALHFINWTTSPTLKLGDSLMTNEPFTRHDALQSSSVNKSMSIGKGDKVFLKSGSPPFNC